MEARVKSRAHPSFQGVTLGWLLGTAAPVWIFVGSFLRSGELQQIRDSSWSFNELETFAEGCLTPGLNSSHAAQFSANRTSPEEDFFFVPPGYAASTRNM